MKEKAIAKKEGTLDVLGNPKVLPEVMDNVQRVKRRIDRANAENLMGIMKKDDEKLRQLYGTPSEHSAR